MAKTLIGMYRGYNVTDSEEYIRAHFLERYGYKPEVVQPTGGGWLLGPVHTGEELRPGEHIVTAPDIRKETP